MKKTKTTATALEERMLDSLPLAPRRPMPDDYDIVRTHAARLKIPSVVMRTDGRYGVAFPVRKPARLEDAAKALGLGPSTVLDSRAWTRLLGCGSFATSHTSGWEHTPLTFKTRTEAEQHAWKLARDLASTRDWP